MTITAKQIKELREKTGAGISDVKIALEESGGDMMKAEAWLERKLGGLAAKKAGREIKAGLIEAYIHSNGRIGALVKVGCETDFVARNPQFKELAHDLAMHIAAMAPAYLSRDTIPPEVWDAERSHFGNETELKEHFDALSLLSQPFIKNQDKTVGGVINEFIGKFGENIKIERFVRYEI